MVRANCLGSLFQRIRRVGIHLAITGRVGAFGRFDQLGRRLKFSHQSVNRCSSHYSFTLACGISVRISKMEIAGISRMNIKKSRVKKPMVPTKIATSQRVNQYMPQELGTKSRWRLITTITKRSSHMPVFTTSETKKSLVGEERTLLNHSDCGIRMLHRISM